MSLQAIFDPMVRAYFKKLYGGGSGGGTANATIAYHADRTYETVPWGENSMRKISDVSSIPEGTTPCFIVFAGSDTGKWSAAVDDSMGISMVTDTEMGAIQIMFVPEELPPDLPEEVAQAFGMMGAGCWMAAVETFNFYLIFDK